MSAAHCRGGDGPERVLRGHKRRKTTQPKAQATANTITGLNKTLAAMITHCLQIGTVPMRRGPCRANLGQGTPATVDDRLNETRWGLQSSGGSLTIKARSFSMSDTTAVAAWSSIARYSGSTSWPVAVSRTPLPPMPPFAASMSGSRKQAFIVFCNCGYPLAIATSSPWNSDTARFRPSVLSAAAIKRAYRRQIVHDRA